MVAGRLTEVSYSLSRFFAACDYRHPHDAGASYGAPVNGWGEAEGGFILEVR